MNKNTKIDKKIIETKKLIEEYKNIPKIGIYLSKSSELSSNHNKDDIYINLQDIFNSNTKKLLKSYHFNNIIDLNFLVNTFHLSSRNHKITLICSDNILLYNYKKHSNIHIEHPKLTPALPHDIKMSILFFENCCRIAIYSSNLVKEEWNKTTQLIWLTKDLPICNQVDKSSFNKDLRKLLKLYQSLKINELVYTLKYHDMSSIKSKLIYTFPGTYKTSETLLGYNQFINSLKNLGTTKENSKTIIITSKIGRLYERDKWLKEKLIPALNVQNFNLKEIEIVYPSIKCVKESYDESLAKKIYDYDSYLHKKQKYLISILREWTCHNYYRTKCLPNMNCYFNISSDLSINWMFISTMRLAKKYFGTYYKYTEQKQLAYTIGILEHPSNYNKDRFIPYKPIIKNFDINNDMTIIVPCDLPLKHYSFQNQPFTTQ